MTIGVKTVLKPKLGSVENSLQREEELVKEVVSFLELLRGQDAKNFGFDGVLEVVKKKLFHFEGWGRLPMFQWENEINKQNLSVKVQKYC